MDELVISGKRYISTKRAGKEYRYHADYIGQLVRAGKVTGQKVGRSWYVSETSLAAYLRSEASEYRPPRRTEGRSATPPSAEPPPGEPIVYEFSPASKQHDTETPSQTSAAVSHPMSTNDAPADHRTAPHTAGAPSHALEQKLLTYIPEEHASKDRAVPSESDPIPLRKATRPINIYASMPRSEVRRNEPSSDNFMDTVYDTAEYDQEAKHDAEETTSQFEQGDSSIALRVTQNPITPQAYIPVPVDHGRQAAEGYPPHIPLPLHEPIHSARGLRTLLLAGLISFFGVLTLSLLVTIGMQSITF